MALSSAGGAASPDLELRTPSSGVSIAQRLPLALAALTVLCQIAYPLTSEGVRDRLTVGTVLLWSAASLSHAACSRGLRFASGLLLISAGVGLLSEVVGTDTGWPFGSYAYGSTLGPRLAGVPLIIPLAWTMMAYPALLVGRVIGRQPGRRIDTSVLAGTLALASWDLFLDPQMVQAGHWHFVGATSTGATSTGFDGTGFRPAVNGIPLTNTAGWIVVSLVIMLLLNLLPARLSPTGDRVSDRVPLGLYLWTYVSSVLAATAFFHRPGVALIGGVVMGVPAVLLIASWRIRSADRSK